MVANFQQIVYNKFTNKRFFITKYIKSKEECIMVQIIAGRKGKKTKYLLDMANTAVKEAKVQSFTLIRARNICTSLTIRSA